VFRRIVVGHGHGGREVGHENAAAVGHGLRDDVTPAERVRLCRHFIGDLAGEPRGVGDENDLRNGVVFGCASRSAATKRAFAESSATTSTSDGPAGKSMAAPAGSAAMICLAAVTHALPGPKILSTLRTDPVPNASAAIACAPPILYTVSTPQSSAATKHGCMQLAVRTWRACDGARRTRRDSRRHGQHDGGGGQRRRARGDVETDAAYRTA
jgi:hypothetical protein